MLRLALRPMLGFLLIVYGIMEVKRMCVPPQKSQWGTKRFNIVDALMAFEKRMEWDKRRKEKANSEQEENAPPCFYMPDPSLAALGGSRFREILDTLNLKVQDIHRLTGIHHSTLSRIVGEKHTPSRKNAFLIAEEINKILQKRGSSQSFSPYDIWPGAVFMNK